MIFLAFFLLGNGLLCAGQVGSGRDEGEHSERTAVKETYKAYLSTWKGKDYSTLNRLLSNDYQAVDFQGIVTTKAHEIETAREDRTYDTLNADVMSIALFGESAVASGLIDASWENYRGSAQRITLRFIAMLPKQKRDWELAATESTKFSKAAAK